jgi:hypothetical protein
LSAERLVEGIGTAKHCESKREREEEGCGEKERYRLETEGKEMEREGCRLGMGTHSLNCMFVTLPTSQLEMSWLKAWARMNTTRVRERERKRRGRVW